MDNEKPQKFYITTPIYYVNARPHIGHTYTTVVCDTLARRQRMLGVDTWFLTGTDEHGQKIERSAAAAGCTPKEFADRVSGEFRTLWERMKISNDDFIRTTEPRHVRGVQALFARLQERGYIYKGSYSGQYCVSDELYVDAVGPGAPCPECGRPTETVHEENYFFKLSAMGERLLKYYAEHPEFIRPETRRNEVIAFVKSGLRDLSVSRTSFKWGIPVPGDPKHVIYVWLDALANYMTAIGFGSDDPADQEKLARYWPADVHMIGKEIVRFHCVYWPAFLLAADLPLPRSIIAHGWLLFEESKMSKSRGNIVRSETILDTLGQDALRYFLLREIVFGQDGAFSFDALVQRYNADLANDLGNLASRSLSMIARYFEGEIPYVSARSRIPADEAIVNLAQQTITNFHDAVRAVSVFARTGDGVDSGGRRQQIHCGERAVGGGRARRSRLARAAGDDSAHLGRGAAHCDGTGAPGDSRGDGAHLDAAGRGRDREVRPAQSRLGTDSGGHQAGQGRAGVSARRQERDRKDATDGTGALRTHPSANGRRKEWGTRREAQQSREPRAPSSRAKRQPATAGARRKQPAGHATTPEVRHPLPAGSAGDGGGQDGKDQR